MKRKLLAILLVVSMLAALFVFPTPAAQAAETGRTFYIDNVNGNDSNSGLSEDQAFKTLGRITWWETGLQAGDTVRLKRGGYWHETLNLWTSGTADAPLTLDCYGDPNDPLPVINGWTKDTAAAAAIMITNQSHLRIYNLHLQCWNPEDPDDYKTGYYRRSGIEMRTYHQGAMEDIVVSGCEFSKITGMSCNTWGYEETLSPGTIANQDSNAAIQMNGWSWENPDNNPGYYKDITIESNYMHDLNVIGVCIGGTGRVKHQNLLVRNNVIYNNGADAIVIGQAINPIIEHNLSYYNGKFSPNADYGWIASMWVWACDGATTRYNEVGYTQYAGNPGQADSTAFDTDLWCTGDFYWMYNYSHDNAGGFLMTMRDAWYHKDFVGYNISENDNNNSNFNSQFALSDDPMIFFNNVFYYDLPASEGEFRVWGSANKTVKWVNNVFYMGEDSDVWMDSMHAYSNNAFVGIDAPEGAIASIVTDNGADLKFKGIGEDVADWTPGNGWSTSEKLWSFDVVLQNLTGYQLEDDSPLIAAGRYVPENLGEDLWGNPLYAATPDIGVFEVPGSTKGDLTPPARPTGLVAAGTTDTTITLAWNAKDVNGDPLDVELYDAVTGEMIAYIMGASTYQVTGLASGENYSYYIKARSAAGVLSEASDTLNTHTVLAVELNAPDATLVGEWSNASGNGSRADYKVSSDPAATATWNLDITQDGFYELYIWLPNGNMLSTNRAEYTVTFADGQTATYTVDQRNAGGNWMLLATHYFKAGQTGSVTVVNKGTGLLAVDSLRMLIVENADTAQVTGATLSLGSNILSAGQTTNVNVIGSTELGKTYNLAAEGATISYTVSNPDVIRIDENGLITALANGRATISASVVFNGSELTVAPVDISVSDGELVFGAVELVDANGNAVPSPIAATSVTAKINVANTGEKARQVTVIVAVYDNYGPKSQLSQTAIINPMSGGDFSVTVPATQIPNGTYVRVFVWDSMDGMHPLQDPITVQ